MRQPTPANILDAVLTTDATGPDRTALRARLRWDYSQVAPVDRRTVEEAAVDILANGQRMQESTVAIGERLIAVKRLLEHGQFGDWCVTEFGMSQRTAQNLMNIARTFDGKSAEISLLSDSSLALLAAPSTPEPARQQAIDEAQQTGKSPSVQRTKEIIAEHRPPAISNQQSPISNSPTPATPKQFAAAVKSATWTGTQPDILPPANAPLPSWAEEDASAPAVNAYAAFPMDEDGRIPAARGLINLYRMVIASEANYGSLTGRFSDTLSVKRDLSAMIGHLEHLIAIIEHPEEEPPAAD